MAIHIWMFDGVKGRASGMIFLRDGALLGSDPYFRSTGSYTSENGTWKGDLLTNQHTPSRDNLVSPLLPDREVASGFSGTCQGDDSEVFGATLVGSRSLSFRATLRWLADN